MKYYKPDWASIQKNIEENIPEDEHDKAWIKECNKWLKVLCNEFGDSYELIESENFIVLSSEDDRYNKHILKFLEFSRATILKNLNGIAADDYAGKQVVIITADQETYYDYIFMFYPDSVKTGLSGGVFLSNGYYHFIFPSHEINFSEPVVAHELTHACLSHLSIPNWLNEGIAVSMEDVVLSRDYFEINNEIITRHQEYWNEDNIQTFWSGSSFSNTDDGQELSYHLAQLLVRNISQDYKQFTSFSKNAHWDDAGEKASLEYLHISLGDLLTGLLGEGDWKPLTKVDVGKRRSGRDNEIAFVIPTTPPDIRFSVSGG